MKTTILTLGIALLSLNAFSQVATWSNPECESGTCELKGIKLWVDKHNDKKMAGNVGNAEIEVSDKSQLKKYAFVQMIKGCVYSTNASGSEVRMGIRSSLGVEGSPFKHPTFVIDSADDSDPIYGSNPDAGFDELRGFEVPRNSFYFNANPALTEKYGRWGGKVSNLKENKLFVNDMPTWSRYELKDGKLTAYNTSLQFKLCVYDVSKIPNRVGSTTEKLSEPIACLDWSSNYIYDFKKRTFNEEKDISPVCL